MGTPPGPPRRGHASHGEVHGVLVQARDIHGGVHVHAPPSPALLADVSLDAPRPPAPVRGRAALLGELADVMTRGTDLPHVLAGPGGVGKSTVAAALAQQAAAQGRTVFWVRAGSVSVSMLEAAVELGAPREEAEQMAQTPGRAARWVWRHLRAADDPWLLVFDNADDPEELAPGSRPGDGVGWLRGSHAGFVLVTTRIDAPAVWAPSTTRTVEPLDPATAPAVLADHAGVPVAEGADALAGRLGRFPLALALAGRIMAAHPSMFPDFQALLDHVGGSVARLDELARSLTQHGDGRAQRPLSEVWALSVDLASTDQTPQARPLLRLVCLLGADRVDLPLRRLPVELLRGGSVDVGALPLDEPAVARALNALSVHGLLSIVDARNGRAVRVHPLVAETTRADMGSEGARICEEAARLLDAQRAHDPALEDAGFRAIVDVRREALGETHPDTLGAAVHRGWLAVVRGVSAPAEEELSALVATAERELGADHRVTLSARHYLAEAHLGLGRRDSAEAEYRFVLHARERTLGPDHPETLSAAHQVALVVAMGGDWDAAREGFRQALEAHQRRGEPEASTALFARQNLAYVALRTGDHAGAADGFRRVLEARQRLLGPDHPHTHDAHYYLALVALERGDIAEARDGFEEVLRARAEILGSEHPDTRRARQRLDEAQEQG